MYSLVTQKQVYEKQEKENCWMCLQKFPQLIKQTLLERMLVAALCFPRVQPV